MNTLYNAVDSRSYCYCDEKKDGKCQICIISIIFTGFEKIVEKNSFNYNFLFWNYTKLCKELIQLFDKKKIALNAFRENMDSGADIGGLANTGA